ncbi:hypothetical protein J8C06_09955 [Chloracidobacterium validum]|uniref:Serine kinase of the HPr protein, regulates carbohydrate metabolism n=1 Tax=Chloracidobacterium validum TaxID=2821543 RepID=A0ABX8B7M1_9BACT|nr:hypothetical protein [Chloracidobacterium validum]QUW02656.1 hypothetical protein J8C06_09955 [Chloracidobacterium validum]
MSSASLSFGVAGQSARQLSLVIETCRYLGLPEVAPEAADIILTDDRPNFPSHEKAGPWLAWKGLTVHRQNSCLTFTYGAWQVVIDTARRLVTPIALAPSGDALASYDCYAFLRLILLFLLRRLGWFELHGGACVHTGRGYIFVGASGSGKTSAVLGLLEAGWDYVSDDALLVRQVFSNQAAVDGAVSALYVRAGRALFSVTTDGLRRFPHLQPHAERRLQHVEKWIVDPAAIWSGRHEPVAQPDFLFFCQLRDAEETQLQPLPMADALARLMVSTPWLALDRDTAEAHLATYRKLIESCYSFTLLMGRDVLHCPSQLATYLDAQELTQLHRTYA